MFKEYSFVFDIDGTLCPIKKKDEKYEDLVPYKEMVEKLRKCCQRGQTSGTFRTMKFYMENRGQDIKDSMLMIEPFDQMNF